MTPNKSIGMYAVYSDVGGIRPHTIQGTRDAAIDKFVTRSVWDYHRDALGYRAVKVKVTVEED
jgi:hypothetical protein